MFINNIPMATFKRIEIIFNAQNMQTALRNFWAASILLCYLNHFCTAATKATCRTTLA